MPWPLSMLTLVNDESPSARAISIDVISCKTDAIQTVKRQTQEMRMGSTQQPGQSEMYLGAERVLCDESRGLN